MKTRQEIIEDMVKELQQQHGESSSAQPAFINEIAMPTVGDIKVDKTQTR